MIRLLPLVIVAGCTLAGIALGFAWGALFRRAPHTWTSRVARRIAGHPDAPDLSDTLAARIAQADQIAATGTADLDTVEQHFRTVPAGRADQVALTAAAALTPDRDPDQERIDAEARRLLAALDVPTIPGDQP